MREVRRMVCDCTTSKEDREMGYLGCDEDCLNRMLFIEWWVFCLNYYQVKISALFASNHKNEYCNT